MQPDATVFVLVVNGLVSTSDLDIEPGFFAALTDGGLRRTFTGLDLSAGEFPQASQRYAIRSPPGEKTAVSLDHGNRDECLFPVTCHLSPTS